MGGRGTKIPYGAIRASGPARYTGSANNEHRKLARVDLRQDLYRQYEIESRDTNPPGINRYLLEKTGRRWIVVSRDVNEVQGLRQEAFLKALENGDPNFDPLEYLDLNDGGIHLDDRFGMERPTLRIVKDGNVTDIYVEGWDLNDLAENMGFQINDTNVNQLSKRLGRILRKESINGSFTINKSMEPGTIPPDPIGLDAIQSPNAVPKSVIDHIASTPDNGSTIQSEFDLQKLVAMGKADPKLLTLQKSQVRPSEVDNNALVINDRRNNPVGFYDTETGEYYFHDRFERFWDFNDARLASYNNVSVAIMATTDKLADYAQAPNVDVQYNEDGSIQYVYDKDKGIQYLPFYDNEKAPKVWDGGGVMSRRMLTKMIDQLYPDLHPERRDHAIHELMTAGRAEFTIMTDRGQEKGHAIVSDKPLIINGQEVDFLIPDDAKGQVKWGTGNDAHITIKFPHGKKTVFGDIQSMTNNGMGDLEDKGFFNSENLGQWAEDDYRTVMTAWEQGDIGTAFERLGEYTTKQDIEGYPLGEFAAHGGRAEWSASLYEKMTSVFDERYNPEQLYRKPKLPIPGGRFYVMPEDVANAAGREYNVQRGQIYVDPKTNSAYVHPDDWVQMADSNPNNPMGIANILGGGDNDDALVIHPFLDRADGKRKYMVYRNPNQSGEYVLLEPAQDSDPLPWKKASGEAATWIENDSRKLPPRIDYRKVKNLDLIIPRPDGESDHYPQGDLTNSMWHAIDRQITNGMIIGAASNEEIIYTATTGRPLDEIIAQQEDMIDATKDGSDASRAAEELARRSASYYKKDGNGQAKAVPNMVRNRLKTRAMDVSQLAGLPDILRSGSPLQIAYAAAFRQRPESTTQAMQRLTELAQTDPELGNRVAKTIRELENALNPRIQQQRTIEQVLRDTKLLTDDDNIRHIPGLDNDSSPYAIAYAATFKEEIPKVSGVAKERVAQLREHNPNRAKQFDAAVRQLKAQFTKNEDNQVTMGQVLADNGWIREDHIITDGDYARPQPTYDRPYDKLEAKLTSIRERSNQRREIAMRRTAPPEEIFDYLYQRDETGQLRTRYIEYGAEVNSAYFMAQEESMKAGGRKEPNKADRETGYEAAMRELSKHDRNEWGKIALGTWVSPNLRTDRTPTEKDPGIPRPVLTWNIGNIDPATGQRVNAFYKYTLEGLREAGVTHDIQTDPDTGYINFASKADLKDSKSAGIAKITAVYRTEVDRTARERNHPQWADTEGWSAYAKEHGFPNGSAARNHVKDQLKTELERRYNESPSNQNVELVVNWNPETKSNYFYTPDGKPFGVAKSSSLTVQPGERYRLNYARHNDGDLEAHIRRDTKPSIVVTGSDYRPPRNQDTPEYRASQQRMHEEADAIVRQSIVTNTQIIVGDDPTGVPKAIVDAANRYDYKNVVVVGIDDKPRNGGVVGGYYQVSGDNYQQRNYNMLSRADSGVFVWDGQERMTEDTYELMRRANKPAEIVHTGTTVHPETQQTFYRNDINPSDYARWSGQTNLNPDNVTLRDIDEFRAFQRDQQRYKIRSKNDPNSPSDVRRITQVAQEKLDRANIDRRFFARYYNLTELNETNVTAQTIEQYDYAVRNGVDLTNAQQWQPRTSQPAEIQIPITRAAKTKLQDYGIEHRADEFAQWVALERNSDIDKLDARLITPQRIEKFLKDNG